jgi:lipid II:glycine glycyltransferase (peptidoglycan interpeptide bridge formation enzyme)
MNVRFANKNEIENWDKQILANPDGGNIFQGKFFAELKAHAGWTPRYIMANDIAMTVIEKGIVGMGKVWYMPKGPNVGDVKTLKKLVGPLREFAKAHGCFTVKMEPELPRGTHMTELGLVKTRHIQPNFATIVLDLSPNLETILTTMPQKGRYAIKRAERDGVTTKAVKATDDNCQIAYDLFRETADDSGFGIRPVSYYRAFWQGYEKAEIGQMFFAYFEGDVVAIAYVLAYGTKGTYKDGASIRKRTAYGASHALQWEAIKWLKTRNVTTYDLCGAPPSDEANNPQHPWHGVGLFKRSFNPEITDYVGAYELPIHNLKSKLWTKFLEKVIRRLYYKVHNESYY